MEPDAPGDSDPGPDGGIQPTIDELLARLLVERSNVRVDASTGRVVEVDGAPPEAASKNSS